MNDITRIQTLFRPHDYYSRMRPSLFTTYLRLALKRAVARGSLDVEDVVGYKVSHVNLKNLCQLFDEIFINCIYHFTSAGDAPLIIDCGSNIGMSILFFKKLYPGARVVGFEPDRTTYGKLEENIRLNNLQHVRVYNQAVSDQNGTITFYKDPDIVGSHVMSVLDKRTSGQKVEIDAVRLSEFITEEVDFLKLDIEGSETLVIRELSETNKLRMIKELIIEYHHHFLDKDDDNLSEFLHLLEKNGFGYQLASNVRIPFSRRISNDLIIYAYRK
ncbi:MAG TPA: FkbM family methyltransferase [Geobacteraceae bacterium]|nr:FkbM family methyltransferase [Geobacteraceae bacterium]